MTSAEIKQLVEEFLRKMGLSFDAVEIRTEGEREVFSIKSPDSHLLIGSKGTHLFALSHLIKKIVSKREAGKRTSLGVSAYTVLSAPADLGKQFMIDVNDYQGAAMESLKNVAKIMGERARSLRTNVELDPMSSYERMVIHSFFQETKDIKTESVGEGERRRVVIKYIETNN